MTTPASSIIGKFGGITHCATALGRAKSTVQRWKLSGHIHPRHYQQILEAAANHGVQLDVRDFLAVDGNHRAFAVSSSSADSTTARLVSHEMG